MQQYSRSRLVYVQSAANTTMQKKLMRKYRKSEKSLSRDLLKHIA
jgi:hypothetical protein